MGKKADKGEQLQRRGVGCPPTDGGFRELDWNLGSAGLADTVTAVKTSLRAMKAAFSETTTALLKVARPSWGCVLACPLRNRVSAFAHKRSLTLWALGHLQAIKAAEGAVAPTLDFTSPSCLEVC